jgi:murein L,D-transpeptidase YcbB/YkuD
MDAASAAAGIFDSDQRYSEQTVDSAEFGRFFAKHPEYRADSASVVGFYHRREMQHAWIVGGSPTSSAESFIQFASAADTASPGQPAFARHLIGLYEQLASGDTTLKCEGCATDLELHLTAEFFRFAARNYNGHLRGDVKELGWFIPRAKKNVGQMLDSLASGKGDLSAYEPVHPQYQLLKRGIGRYRAASGTPWLAIALPAGTKKIEPGDSSAVIGEIRARLQLLGDSSAAAGDRYEATFEAAVKNFQERHGIKPDGVIGASFLKAINVPVEDRLRTMLVNIERLRWMPEKNPPNLLLVNIPEFRLHVYEDGLEVSSMDVVVGSRATSTVVFSDSLTKIVFSPSWGVPASITRNEILPAMRKDPAYLAKHDMEVIGGTKELPELRQRPGPANPLGQVKFLFPNSHDIYMHDTPSRALFARDSRAGSHGCVRLSRAEELAVYLLRANPDWPVDRIQSAMEAGKETTVQLTEPRPVMIGYFTAWVDDRGRLNFRDDVYGHDAKLARELFAR